MYRCCSFASAVACLFVSAVLSDSRDHHQYCIIGAGPGGLQLAYFLHRARRDYIVYEKGNRNVEHAFYGLINRILYVP